MLIADNEIYNKTISGIANVCNDINKIIDNTIKINRILFPLSPKLLSFKENIGSSATIKSENEIVTMANMY